MYNAPKKNTENIAEKLSPRTTLVAVKLRNFKIRSGMMGRSISDSNTMKLLIRIADSAPAAKVCGDVQP